jgi:hypothetical protein
LAAMILQVSGLVLRVSTVLAAAAVAGQRAAEGYAVSGFVFYLVYLVVVCRVAGVSMPLFVKACRPALVPASYWTAAGIAIVSMIRTFG